MLRLIRYVVLLLLCLTANIKAQDNAVERYLEVRGTSEMDMEPLARATASLYEGNTMVKSMQTAGDGSFSFRLEINKEYTIVLEKEGLVSKRISFNTAMPDEEKGAWMNEFSMGLVKRCEGVDYSVLKEPVDKVSFDNKRREFVSDKEYVTRLRPRIESMMIKNDQCMLDKYEAAVKKGDQLTTQKNYQEAIAAYKEANEIYPTEVYPSRKIAEINAQINKQQNSAELYQKTIEEADLLASQQKYPEALLKYRSAARLNAQDGYPNKRIAEIESAMAQQQAAKQAQQSSEDRYNQAMAKASVSYTHKDYVTAKQYYQEALEIKPAESLPKTRMQEIETVLAKKAADEAIQSAENTRKAAFESEYRALITKADEQFKAKMIDEARQSYSKAMSMKPADPYPAQRIKTIDNAVAAQQAALQKSKEDNYAAAVVAANKALAQNQFPLAKEYYQKALSYKPDDLTAKTQLAEADRLEMELAKRKSLEEQYAKTIATADEYLKNKDLSKAKDTYTQALAIKPGDQYAQSKIASIDNSIASEQAARLKATEEGYKAAIGAANTAIAQKSYTQAKEYLQRALSIKPGDAYATAKSAEVEHLIEEQRKIREQEQLVASQYKDVIASADKSFNDRDYATARASYGRALQIKPGDTYANQKISSIDNILAAELAGRQKQVEETYKAAMDRGTAALTAKDYSTARNAFQEALAVKPADASAKAKITEIDLLMKQAQEKLEADQVKRKKYDEVVKTADQQLSLKNYTGARISYEKAVELMPNETYPRQKLDEVIRANAEQERLLAEKQANENAYNLALVNADKYFKAKDYIQARDEYGRALKLKPEETFPKDRISEIENLIRIRQKERDEAKAKADAYTAAMNAGNAYFESKNYLSAKSSYNEALKQMPGDALANDQLKKIEYLLAEADRQNQADAARKATYESLIKSADNAYDAGNYQVAKDSYKKALTYEPASAYAKQRITHIDEIMRTISQTTSKSTASATTGKPKATAAIPMAELNFKNESERQKYLDELKSKYPSGITLEKYREQYKETYRYIIVRDNQAQDFRHVRFTTYSGAQYSVNGKPITQQYFLSQTKVRPGEGYQEIEMQ
jgi:tetratricopeptide (TPR) repeat protein